MPAQVKTVKRANKDQGSCSNCGDPLPAGSAYRYYRPGFRSRVKVRVCMKPECTPRQSQLDTSRMSDAWAAIEDAQQRIEEVTTVEEAQSVVDDCAAAIRSVADEYEESVSNAPMLEDSLREKIEALEQFADNLESLSLDEEPEEPTEPEEPQRESFEDDDSFNEAHDTWEDEYEEFGTEVENWKEECGETVEAARDAVRNALSETEF